MKTNIMKYGKLAVQEIFAGQDKCPAGYDVTVSTWQSIDKADKKWFENFKCIMVDEAHLAQAKSLVGIMEKTETTKNRIWFYGNNSRLTNS